jgi:hypothetical protein
MLFNKENMSQKLCIIEHLPEYHGSPTVHGSSEVKRTFYCKNIMTVANALAERCSARRGPANQIISLNSVGGNARLLSSL